MEDLYIAVVRLNTANLESRQHRSWTTAANAHHDRSPRCEQIVVSSLCCGLWTLVNQAHRVRLLSTLGNELASSLKPTSTGRQFARLAARCCLRPATVAWTQAIAHVYHDLFDIEKSRGLVLLVVRETSQLDGASQSKVSTDVKIRPHGQYKRGSRRKRGCRTSVRRTL